MRVFDFTLLSGYEFSGVDVAQGFRARLFAKNNVNAKFIFTELPTIRDMELYGSQKIKRGQIMSAHLFMIGRLDMSLSVKKEALLENEKENYEYDNIDEDGKVIRLYNSGEKSVEILCDEDGFVINESLFKNGKKYLVNYYTDSLSYTELYNWDNDSNDGLNPEPVQVSQQARVPQQVQVHRQVQVPQPVQAHRQVQVRQPAQAHQQYCFIISVAR